MVAEPDPSQVTAPKRQEPREKKTGDESGRGFPRMPPFRWPANKLTQKRENATTQKELGRGGKKKKRDTKSFSLVSPVAEAHKSGKGEKGTMPGELMETKKGDRWRA